MTIFPRFSSISANLFLVQAASIFCGRKGAIVESKVPFSDAFKLECALSSLGGRRESEDALRLACPMLSDYTVLNVLDGGDNSETGVGRRRVH